MVVPMPKKTQQNAQRGSRVSEGVLRRGLIVVGWNNNNRIGLAKVVVVVVVAKSLTVRQMAERLRGLPVL